MKLSYTAHNQTTTIENDEDGLSLDELLPLFKQLLLGSGFSFDGEVIIDEEDSI